MNDETLKALLADYAAPTPDEGFSDQVMRAIEADRSVEGFDVEMFKLKGNPIRRSWIVSLVLGFVVGLLSMRLGLILPDLPKTSNLPAMLETGWGIYALVGVGLAGLFLYMESEA